MRTATLLLVRWRQACIAADDSRRHAGARSSVSMPLAAAMLSLLAAAACSGGVPPDAYGNVEATEVVVSAEGTGRLVTYTVTEGETLAAGAVVATIDSAGLAFEREQITAQQAASTSRVAEARQQIRVLDAQRGAAEAQRDAAKAQRDSLVSQHEIARRAYERTTRLFAEQAATAQQLDQAERDTRVLADQIRAQEEQIKAHERLIAANADQIRAARAQEQTAQAQTAAVRAQVSQVGERIRKSDVVNPIAGTVLTTYAKQGEVVQAGQPLYRIANLTSVEVRAYVTEPQLTAIRLGQEVLVSVDAGARARQSISGTIAWISSRAEFTPTPIQTREERADMVYAIRIRVPNAEGVLKIGMPADVQFVAGGAAQ